MSKRVYHFVRQWVPSIKDNISMKNNRSMYLFLTTMFILLFEQNYLLL